MAEVRSGSFRTTGYSDPGYTDHYVFSWELVSQNIVDCTSTIKWSVTGAGASNSAYWTYVQEKYVTVNGVTQTNTTKVATYNGTVAFSGTSVIKHSTSTGKGSFTASCGGAFYSYGSYNSTGSGSWDLPTIARATTPIFNNTEIALGTPITIGLYPADATFKHKLTYSVGGLSGQTSGLSIGTNFTAQGTVNVTFTPPTSLGAQFPRALYTTCTVTCQTYNASGTLIGTAVNYFRLNVPNYTPTISAINITGLNLLNGAYVEKRSSAKVDISASSSYGATINICRGEIDGTTYNSQSFTTALLTTGTKKVKVTVQDSRGKNATLESSAITVYAYSIPYITSFSLTRQSDGTTVIAAVKGGFAAVNNKNSKNIKVTLNGVTNTVTSSTYAFDATTTFTNVPTDQTLEGTLSLTDAYTADKPVTQDAVLPTVAVTMDFHKDGDGIAMGKVAETRDLLDVAWNERVHKNLTVDGATTLNKAATIADTDWKTLILKRVNAIGAVTIQFQNNTGSLGFIGMTGEELNTPLRRWTSDGVTAYTVLDTDLVKDFVVEQGTSGIWTYRKWNSGLAECFGSQPVTNMLVGTVWGALYCSARINLPNFPFTFKSVPQVNLNWNATYTAMIDGALGVSTTSCGYTFIFRADSVTLSGSVAIQAIGRWK